MTRLFTGKLAAVAAAVTLALSGCQQQPADNITVNVPSNKQVSKITYVIRVMDATGMGTSAGSAALQGATLRYFNAATSQYANVTTTSNADGNIILNNVHPGNFSGELTMPNYGRVNFISDLTKAGNDTAYTAVSTVHMFPKTASLTGRVYGNYDMRPGYTPTPTGRNDVKEVDLMLHYRLHKEGANAYPMGSGPGRLVSVAVEPSALTSTQGESSNFEFTETYVTVPGMMDAFLSMVPKNFTAGTGPSARDSVFTLAAGDPRNHVQVRLFRDRTTNLGAILAKPSHP